ncbi:MAG: M20 family metallopeptidase [Planctomycetes bacterium]|nr:M20 family metallopeptidase [Planctomycetota bacterium]
MGRPLTGPEVFEVRVTRYLEDFFQKLGVPYQRQTMAERRDNIFAWVERPDSRRTVMLEAHQDTVPTDGMKIDPFRPLVKDGRIYGRGACDIKGGMTAMLGAFARIAKERPKDAPTVVMACSVDEEFTFRGVLELATLWTEGRADPGTPLVAPPDMAVVAEPTSLDIVVAHKGAVRWKICTRGRACHSSKPQEGINAIYRMARVLGALERYAAKVGTIVPPHPLCGPATLSVGRIEGGISTNTVPDECLIEIDRRILPGEDSMQARSAIENFLRAQPDVDFDFDMLEPWMRGHALSDEHNSEVASLLGAAVDEVRGTHRKIGVPFGTDAAKLAAAGVPSVVFGPGSISQAHTNDEWLPLEELEQASEVLYRFLRRAG